METQADHLVMLAVREGDVERIGVLFDRHHRMLFNFFLRLTANRGLSEDLVQEVFFRMLKYRHTYQAGTNFTAWMYQVARNAHLDQARKHRLEIVPDEEPAWEDVASDDRGPAREAGARAGDRAAAAGPGTAAGGETRSAGAEPFPESEIRRDRARFWIAKWAR